MSSSRFLINKKSMLSSSGGTNPYSRGSINLTRLSPAQFGDMSGGMPTPNIPASTYNLLTESSNLLTTEDGNHIVIA